MKHGDKKLFLFDAMSIIFRAYYALNKNPRITSKGLNTSAILGFTNTLYEVIHNEKPTHIAVAFDSHGPTIRHAEYAQYKAHRDNTPEDIVTSIPYIKEVLKSFGIHTIELPGYEADDIIGTMAKKAEREGFITYMMTTDKDYGQLVSENIFLYKPAHLGSGISILGEKEICEKYNIKEPSQLIDILGIWGDAVDNIPGIKGIGEVGAKKLINEFGSIENLITNADNIKNEKLKEKVKADAESALISKMLATIILDVPIDFNEEDLRYQLNLKQINNIFSELEFKSLYNRILKDLQNPQYPTTINNANTTLNLFAQDNMPTTELSVDKAHYSSENQDYKIINDWQSFLSCINVIKNAKQFAFHIEINELQNIETIAFATKIHQAIQIKLPQQKEEYQQWINSIIPLFTDINIEKICYSLKSFFKLCCQWNIPTTSKYFDVLLAHYVLEPELRHNLETLADTYLDYRMIEEDKNNLLLFNDNPNQYIFCEKVDIILQLKTIFEKQLQEKESINLFNNIELPLVGVLAQMESIGVNIDVDFLNAYSKVLEEEINNIKKEIYSLANEEFNISSPKQLGVILFEKLQIIKNAKLTKSKQYQTGEEVLQKLKHKHPIVDKILYYRGLSKLKSTYVDSFPLLVNKKTNHIHTQFNQTVTATGRLSSSNPNLQNIPIRDEGGREIRKAFIPSDEEHILLAADYSQIELRIVATLSKDENMLNAFFNDTDIHTATASRIYALPIENITKEMRRTAKTVNFGILYGMGPFGLSERLNISRKEANELISQYFEKYPKIRQYIDNQILFAQEHGYVETIMKRRRYLKNINSKNANLRNFDQRNAVNAPIQGSAADLIKIAMINVFNDLKKYQLQSNIILQVHDELVLNVKKTELDIVKELVKRNMTTAIDLPIPLTIDMNVGNNWLEAH